MRLQSRLVASLGAVLIAGSGSIAVASDPAPARTVSISASGDLLAHNTLYWKAETNNGYEFAPMFKALIPVLNADVDICHLETPLTRGTPAGYPLFKTPYQLADAIAATGWEGCSTVSNHSLDAGLAGLNLTYRALRARGIQTAGTKPTKEATNVAWYTTASGVRVAQIAYSYGFNGLTPPADKPWVVNKIRVGAILKAAEAVRTKGAELVVVSLHWGTEYQDQPNSWQRDIAKQITASPFVDVIIGHHSHVLQSAAMVNGKPVIYGLGNLWSAQGPWSGMSSGQHGAIARLRFEITENGAKFLSGTYVPTLTVHRSWKVQPAARVTQSDQTSEACRAIKDAASHLGTILSGPKYCPSR